MPNGPRPLQPMRCHPEVDRLKRLCGLPLPLMVRWMPSATSPMVGEVKGDRILIYTIGAAETRTVLRHEVIDYCVSQAISSPD